MMLYVCSLVLLLCYDFIVKDLLLCHLRPNELLIIFVTSTRKSSQGKNNRVCFRWEEESYKYYYFAILIVL